jgi:mRNA-degrading endonuclease RelE of RelBE toxin-antitoxin system
MVLLKTKNYKKSIYSLSKKDQILLLKQEKLLTEDVFNPKLHTKKLKGFPDDKVFSFRITSAYRGIFRISKDNIILFAVGHRKDIYQDI